MNNREDTIDCNVPSFFKNSCPGNDEDVVNESTEFAAESEECFASARPKSIVDECDALMQKGMNLGGRGGFTCCVPGCFSNSNRDVDLSFYVIPDGKSKEEILLRKKWLHMISRKDFQPTDGHRVCSKHFVGGRKTYMNNVPTLVPKMKGKDNLKKRRVINRKPVDSLPVDSQEHFDVSGSDDDEK